MVSDPPPRNDLRPEGMFSPRFIIGIIISALGAIFLLDSLGWLESRDALRYVWPLIFVAIGVVMLSKPRRSRRRKEGWAFIIVGLWIFIGKLGWLEFSFWGVLFPSVLLFIGGMLVYRSLQPPRIAAQAGDSTAAPADDHAEYIRSFAILSGSELRPISRPFRGADLTSVLAGVQLDLTSARMEGDVARIDVFACCGGIEIFVPPDWTVTSKVATLMGAYTDKRRPTTTLPTKTLIIDGFAVMGGIEVKN